MRRVTIFLFFIFLLGLSNYFSGARVPEFENFIKKTWTTDDGLTQNAVTTICQTGDGYLWLGTQNGLCRFDGSRFETFNSVTVPQMTHNYITSLMEDQKGVLWIGTRNGLLRYTENEFQRFSTAEPLGSLYVHFLFQDRSGRVLIGSHEPGLIVYHDGISNPYRNELPNGVRVISEADGNHIWLATDHEIYSLGLTGLKIELTADQLDHSDIYCLLPGPDRTLYIGASEGVYVTNRHQKISQKFPIEEVNTLTMDYSGNIWAGTDSFGLFRIQGSDFNNIKPTDWSNNEVIYSIFHGVGQTHWIGSSTGLHCYYRSRFKTITSKEGLSHDITWTVFEDSHGSMWVGTNIGLNRIRNGVITDYRSGRGLDSLMVSTLAEDSSGRLWAGSWKNGLFFLDGHSFKKFQNFPDLNNVTIRSLIKSRSGGLWLATDKIGILGINAGKIKVINQQHGLSSNKVMCLLEDHNGDLWAGTDGDGLNLIREERIRIFSEKDGLGSNVIFTICEDSAHDIWVGSENRGITRIRQNHLVPLTTRDGLKDNGAFQIIDDQQYLWVSGWKGVSRILKSEINDYLEGKIAKIQPILFGKADGILSAECSGGFQPAGYQSKRGEIWFTTNRGVAVLDNRDEHLTNLIPPIVKIRSILLNDTEPCTDKFLTLPHTVKKIEIFYTAISFSIPQDLIFKYKLEGYEQSWLSPRSSNDRVITYTNLSPGNYTFRIKSQNRDRIRSEEQTIKIKILRPFWQKWWFLAAAALSFAFLSYILITLLIRFSKILKFWKKKNSIGQYRLIEKIGSGGMASVYKAVHKNSNRKNAVALKLMKDDLLPDPKLRIRFAHEGLIIDKINHPHIVKIIDRGESNNRLYIIMELLRGVTLADKIEKMGPLPLDDVIRIGFQTSLALQAIHQAGIIHRDLKPQNIMLIKNRKSTEWVKILDFVIAKTESLPKITETGMIVGSISYIAPEQLRGSKYSQASDIYALGIILYEMLTGKKPFCGETAIKIMQEILKGNVIDIAKYRQDVPLELNHMVYRMIDIHPDKRPKHNEILQLLENLQHKS